MKLFLFDLETTGLNIEEARILEFGYIYYDWLHQKPISQGSHIWYANNYPEEWPEAEKINGIHPGFAKANGRNPKDEIYKIESYLKDCSYLVAHNGRDYDVPILRNEVKRWRLEQESARILNMPLIDTKTDLEWKTAPRSKHLGHLAYDCGVVHDVNQKHSALFDCQLMLGILKKFDLEEVILAIQSPLITIRAYVNFDTRDMAKIAGFFWNKEKQAWLKTIRQHELLSEKEKCKIIGFDIAPETPLT